MKQPTLFDYTAVQPPLTEQYANYTEYKISRKFLYLKNNGYLGNLNKRAEIAAIMSNDENLRKSCSIMTFAHNGTFLGTNEFDVKPKTEVQKLYNYVDNLVFLNFIEKLKNIETMSEREFINTFDRYWYHKIREKLDMCYSYAHKLERDTKRRYANIELAMNKMNKYKEEFENIEEV